GNISGNNFLGGTSNTSTQLGFYSDDSYANGWQAYGATSGVPNTVAVVTSGAERMRISSSGNVGIGTTGPSEKLHVVGNLRVQGSTDCTLGNGAGGTNCSSDIRLKTNLETIENPLEKIMALRGVEFDWNEKSHYPGRHDIGVIAQDVEKQFPTAVVEDHEGIKKVDYAVLVAPLIEAVKELHRRFIGLLESSQKHSREIASVKAENAELRKKTTDLERRLEALEKQLQTQSF
ncbi:MAG: hypothetical protein GW917_04000, partial [Bdellovibrionales bacterium]|nr:hypothetical protein [Bdellovibrionales bacterium]